MKGTASCFEELVVWQKAHQFVLGVYRVSTAFPPEERYGLTSQIRRAAVSIPANIAEGFKRRGKPDKLRFLNMAEASLEEGRYYLILLRDLGFLRDPGLSAELVEISKLLRAYSEAIERSRYAGS